MEDIYKTQADLVGHPVYSTFNSIESIRHFMRFHVFAVWDFMSLLKSLQNHITCTTLPWRPSAYPAELVRFINQIVVGEESDVDQEGQAISHFDLYLKAMKEVGASTQEIESFLNKMDYSIIPKGAREFVVQNIDVAQNGHIVEVASSFFFGREKLIPEMFTAMINVLEKEGLEAPTFRYYLQRHIDVDGDEHGPLALKCLEALTANSEELKVMAQKAGLKALAERKLLWDHVYQTRNYENSVSSSF